jgi:hypothetical protein
VQLISCRFKFKLLGFPHGFTPDDEDQRARYATYALDRRAAEAATVRIRANELLDGHGQDRPVIVLGDLNDTEYSATTTLLQGPGGSEIGTGGFSHPDQGDAYRLGNLGRLSAGRRSRVKVPLVRGAVRSERARRSRSSIRSVGSSTRWVGPQSPWALCIGGPVPAPTGTTWGRRRRRDHVRREMWAGGARARTDRRGRRLGKVRHGEAKPGPGAAEH